MEIEEEETKLNKGASTSHGGRTHGNLPHQLRGPVVGRLLGLVERGGAALVALVDARDQVGMRARSTIDLYGVHVGREVLIVFEGGDASKPVVTGVLRGNAGDEAPPTLGTVEISVDGERMVVTAKNELVFRCGKSQLILREDGRIEISGETVVTKANGVNRILGGSVQLN